MDIFLQKIFWEPVSNKSTTWVNLKNLLQKKQLKKIQNQGSYTPRKISHQFLWIRYKMSKNWKQWKKARYQKHRKRHRNNKHKITKKQRLKWQILKKPENLKNWMQRHYYRNNKMKSRNWKHKFNCSRKLMESLDPCNLIKLMIARILLKMTHKF